MTGSGVVRSLSAGIGGRPLEKANFPLRDPQGRVWFSVTMREEPWTRQLNSRADDGYVAVIDDREARIVDEGFCGTNEIRFDAAEGWLQVVESTGRRISRLRVGPDATLSGREVYGPADLGGHLDGFAFDAHGNLWVTLIFADRLIALTPEGDVLTLLDDGDASANAAYERASAARQVTPQILAANAGRLYPWMASLTFGGPDLQTVYLGSLRGTTLPAFRSPVMIHWAERALRAAVRGSERTRHGAHPVMKRTVLTGDLGDLAVLAAVAAFGPDTVFHLASVPGAAAEADPALLRRVNLSASLDLLDTLAALRTRPRVVYASSIALYGPLGPAPVDDDPPACPALTYGTHKAMVGRALADHTRRSHVSGLALHLPGLVACPAGAGGFGSAFMSDLMWAFRAGQP